MLLESRIVSCLPVSGKTLRVGPGTEVPAPAHDHVFRHASYSTLKEHLVEPATPPPAKHVKRANWANYSLAKFCVLHPNYARADGNHHRYSANPYAIQPRIVTPVWALVNSRVPRHKPTPFWSRVWESLLTSAHHLGGDETRTLTNGKPHVNRKIKKVFEGSSAPQKGAPGELPIWPLRPALAGNLG